MTISIVLGLGFGDEGKGLMTDFLCRQTDDYKLLNRTKKSLVVRFSGGHNAGHTVVNDLGETHVFSSIGSGSFQGADTLISKYCTFYPVAYLNEYMSLMHTECMLNMQRKPKIYVDPLCPVTTPYDVYENMAEETAKDSLRHGSVGVGIGTTMRRNKTPYKLYAQDLKYPKVVEQKMKAIEDYYTSFKKTDNHASKAVLMEMISKQEFNNSLTNFYYSIKTIMENKYIEFMPPERNLNNYDNIVFEGSQGILLDMDFGFFPNVTYANTTSKNAIEFIKERWLDIEKSRRSYVNKIYVTRCYQTRHGNGFMSNEINPELQNNEKETNVLNEWQGNFRTGYIDFDLIRYAIDCDSNFILDNSYIYKKAAVTCLDQLKSGKLTAFFNGEKFVFDVNEEFDHFFQVAFRENVGVIFKSYSPNSSKIVYKKYELNAI